MKIQAGTPRNIINKISTCQFIKKNGSAFFNSSLFWPGNAGIVVPRIVIAVGTTVGAIGAAIFEAVHLALSART